MTPLDDPGAYSAEVQLRRRLDVRLVELVDTVHLNQEESRSRTAGRYVDYHDSVTATAKLTDPDGGAPIAGKTVKFTLGVGDT